jgi:hypothetical protein
MGLPVAAHNYASKANHCGNAVKIFFQSFVNV